MKSLLIMLILAATVTLGALNARRYVRGTPDPVLIAVHLLLGLAGLETLVFSGGASSDAPGGSLGAVAAGLLALAVFCALLSAILRGSQRGAANVLLATHAVCGAAGFLAALGWALQ